MIVIFEGAIGTGKTSLARALSARWKAPIYRAFRSNPDDHSPHTEPRLLQLKHVLPINSWQEDLYAADLLSVLDPHPNLILDRSMLSALAYNQLPDTERELVLSLWAERMVAAGGVLVHLRADQDWRQLQAGPRFWVEEQDVITGRLREALQLQPALTAFSCDNHINLLSPDRAAEELEDALLFGATHSTYFKRIWGP